MIKIIEPTKVSDLPKVYRMYYCERKEEIITALNQFINKYFIMPSVAFYYKQYLFIPVEGEPICPGTQKVNILSESLIY